MVSESSTCTGILLQIVNLQDVQLITIVLSFFFYINEVATDVMNMIHVVQHVSTNKIM